MFWCTESVSLPLESESAVALALVDGRLANMKQAGTQEYLSTGALPWSVWDLNAWRTWQTKRVTPPSLPTALIWHPADPWSRVISWLVLDRMSPAKRRRAGWLLLLLLSRFSRVRLCATPWTAAYQAPPSMGFSRHEYWNGVPLPSPAGWLSPVQMETYKIMTLVWCYEVWFSYTVKAHDTISAPGEDHAFSILMGLLPQVCDMLINRVGGCIWVPPNHAHVQWFTRSIHRTQESCSTHGYNLLQNKDTH